MSDYCNSFTAEAMRAFGIGLAAAHQQRQELLVQSRSQTKDLLAAARSKRSEVEAERRKSAAGEADARRLFTSELRSEVHALRNRFELARRDTVTDLQHLATEVRAAREAVRAWPGRTAPTTPRHSTRAAAKAGAHASAPSNGSKAEEHPPRHHSAEDSSPEPARKAEGPPSRRRHG
jgi:hypothetical protein